MLIQSNLANCHTSADIDGDFPARFISLGSEVKFAGVIPFNKSKGSQCR